MLKYLSSLFYDPLGSIIYPHLFRSAIHTHQSLNPHQYLYATEGKVNHVSREEFTKIAQSLSANELN